MKFLEKEFKHIFVGFDNTLYLHDWTESYITSDCKSDIVDYINKGSAFYDKSKLNSMLIKYLREQKSRYSAKILLLTWACSSLEADAKFNFIRESCPLNFDGFVSVSEMEKKIDVIISHCLLGAELDEILLIDECTDLLYSAVNEEIQVRTPQYIVNEMIKDLPNDWLY